MWLLGNATADEDITEAQAKLPRGIQLLQTQDRREAARDEIAAAHAIRAALPDATLCADANCGLTLAAAKRYAERTRDAGSRLSSSPSPRAILPV